ncbi:MAG: hypothetical protein B7Z78_06290 [Rhodospirillales bacterium 20-60-12]|nr:MAG: hypothetical protein B7Z78_06290 [Rhodospirillales bacterium 20-60-12]
MSDEPDSPPQSIADWQSRAEAAERLLEDHKHATDLRIAAVELKAEAIRAGMIDLDGLKLIEPDDLKFIEPGNTATASEIIDRLRNSKPWLFSARSSSSGATAPKPEPPRARHARDMTHTEWRAAREALLRR